MEVVIRVRPCTQAQPGGIPLGTQVLPVTEPGSHLSNEGNDLICHIVIISVLRGGSNLSAEAGLSNKSGKSQQ